MSDSIKFVVNEHIGTPVYWYLPDRERLLQVKAGEEIREGALVCVHHPAGRGYIVMKLGYASHGLVAYTQGRGLVAQLAYQPDLECVGMFNMEAIRKLELFSKEPPTPLCHRLYHDKLGNGVFGDTCPECGFKKEDTSGDH